MLCSSYCFWLQTYDIAPHLIVPHASYLLNCGSGVLSERENSRESLVDDLRRCQSLGLPLFNFHPGSIMEFILVFLSLN
jgi:endonuclease IV